MRRILTRLYPGRTGNGRHPEDAREGRFLGRFVDRRLKRVGTRVRHIGRVRLLAGAVLAVVALNTWGLIYYYNRFLSMDADVRAARSQIGVQLQRRKDIVAELNTIVLAYAKHEKEIFEHAVDTRKDIMRPTPATLGPEASAPTARLPAPMANLDASLSRILAVAEGFPGLRLSENFQRMMDALVEVETTIAEKRMLLNARSNEMATAVEVFPGFVFNWVLRFKTPEFYVPDENVQEPITLEMALPPPNRAQPAETQGQDQHE